MSIERNIMFNTSAIIEAFVSKDAEKLELAMKAGDYKQIYYSIFKEGQEQLLAGHPDCFEIPGEAAYLLGSAFAPHISTTIPFIFKITADKSGQCDNIAIFAPSDKGIKYEVIRRMFWLERNRQTAPGWDLMRFLGRGAVTIGGVRYHIARNEHEARMMAAEMDNPWDLNADAKEYPAVIREQRPGKLVEIVSCRELLEAAETIRKF